MYTITEKRKLNDTVTLMSVHAPVVAARAKAGQFIIFRTDEYGERVPLTIADCNPENGDVTIVFQHVGRSTKTLGAMSAGDTIADFAGPLGKPAKLDGIKKICVVGGGVGCAGESGGGGIAQPDRGQRVVQRAADQEFHRHVIDSARFFLAVLHLCFYPTACQLLARDKGQGLVDFLGIRGYRLGGDGMEQRLVDIGAKSRGGNFAFL